MQAYEMSRQPVEAHQSDPHPEGWSTARSSIGATSARSLFRRRHNESQNGSAVKYSYGDGHTTTRDGNASDSVSVASASTAAGTSIVTQATNTTAQTAPPAYDAVYAPAAGAGSASPSSDTFQPTLHLQIDASGRGGCMTSALFASSTEQVTPVYVVDESALAAAAVDALHRNSPQTAYYSTAPAFLSLRKSRGSNSCSLAAGAGYSLLGGSRARPLRVHGATDVDDQHIISTTTYRWGPGRPPRINVGGDLSATALSDSSSAWDSFEVQNTAIWSRRQRIQTRLGTFEWRYGSRAERKDLTKELLWQIGVGADGKSGDDAAVGGVTDKKEKKRLDKEAKAIRKHHDVKCLLILDHITHDAAGSSSSGSASGTRETRRPVVRFIRNGELRTPGSSRHSAGNGGRLQIDLRPWEAVDTPDADVKKRDTADGLDREMLIIAIVSSAICLLKKEVDRRKGEEAAIISSSVS